MVQARNKSSICQSGSQLPESGYSVWPATQEDICRIAQNAKRVYTGLDVIPQETMLGWYKANPNGFWVVKDKTGTYCGNLDLLALKPDVMQRFIDGEIIEREIQGDYIYCPSESDKIESIYIESLVVVNPGNMKTGNALALRKLLENFYAIVSSLCDPVNIKKIYAIAASDGGMRILSKLGFSMIGKHQRQDDHNTYFADAKIFWQRIKRLSNRAN